MATTNPDKKNVGYLLPAKLVRAIKREAFECEVYPAKIVEQAVSEYLAKPTRRKRNAATA